MITELYIEGEQADISTTLASLLTFAIDDIKDFSSRQTAFSKTVVLPGSQRNNKLLGSIFEVAINNDYDPGMPNIDINFNASASAECILFQDFLQTFKGTLRILQINIDRGRIEYEVSITGDLSTLNVRLSSGLLENLDFSEYNSIYNATNIAASWTNAGSGIYYPLIDYGTYSVNKHDWRYGTFRPAFFVKEYIDKMFEAAGFRYSSTFFNTDFFKSLIIPYNRKILTKSSDSILFRSAPTTSHDGDVDPNEAIEYSGDITTVDFTTPDDKVFTYTGSGYTGNIEVELIGEYTKTSTAAAIQFHLYLNGSIVASDSVGSGSVTGSFNEVITYPVSLATSDQIWVEYDILPHWHLTVRSNLKVTSGGLIEVPVSLGDTIDMNTVIPKNIRQVDFLVSITKMFNLYISEDKFDNRLLYIEPFVNFFSEESQNAVDWTYKLDRNQNISITPMSEINAKIYNFTYKDDSDYYNDLYKKRYNQSYGSYVFDTTFEFVDQTQTVDLIFASTPLVGYVGEDKVYPTIFKLNGTTEESTDSVIRIMQTKQITGVTDWDLLSEDGLSTINTYDYYGYAGHFDDPDNVAVDINFGPLQELFFILVVGDLTVTLFNVYWSAYMAEITDKDSKLLTGKFYLTPADILNLDFSKYVNVDGNLFRLNKITDYNVTKPDLCAIELLKVINTLY